MSSETSDPLSPAFLDALRLIVGVAGLVTDEDTCRAHHTDWMGRTRGNALALVKPASTAEVAAVLGLCAREGIRVVPQGGLTGLSGGALPAGDGNEILLSLARMNHILAIDPIGCTMTVEAGVVLGAIQLAA